MPLMTGHTHAGEWFHTPAAHKHAHWTYHPHGDWPVIRSVYDPKDPSWGRVWPARTLPGLRPGYVAFVDEHPSLRQARDWMPEHNDVWDAVEAEHHGLRKTA